MLRKFLLIDDDQDDTELFYEALKNLDGSIEFYSGHNGRELLVRLDEGKIKPEVIFLDINMPEMNGWECLAILKNNDRLKEIPVVMYSTSSAMLDGRKAINKGAHGFLEKPPSYVELQEFLRELIPASVSDLHKQLRKIQSTKAHRLIAS